LNKTLYIDWICAFGNGVQWSGESLRRLDGMEDSKSQCECVN